MIKNTIQIVDDETEEIISIVRGTRVVRYVKNISCMFLLQNI